MIGTLFCLGLFLLAIVGIYAPLFALVLVYERRQLALQLPPALTARRARRRGGWFAAAKSPPPQVRLRG